MSFPSSPGPLAQVPSGIPSDGDDPRHRYQSKSDIVTAALRELIISGELRAGAPLRQRDLAIRFGVSPTPVREALRRLEAQGLVERDVHRGASVVKSDFGPNQENYEIRAVLEALAARLAAERITRADVERLRELQRQHAASRDDATAAELNRHFHFAIYEAARTPMVLAVLRLLWQAFPDGPLSARPHAQSARQHAAIVEALRAGDPDLAERLTREHILGAQPGNPERRREKE